MPITRQSESEIDGFTMKEYRYDSGLVEISFYSPEIIRGAGQILRGMISKQPGRASKWVGYTSRRNRVAVGLKKQAVIEQTANEIKIDMARDGSMNMRSAIC
jgi:hypothetical protein